MNRVARQPFFRSQPVVGVVNAGTWINPKSPTLDHKPPTASPCKNRSAFNLPISRFQPSDSASHWRPEQRRIRPFASTQRLVLPEGTIRFNIQNGLAIGGQPLPQNDQFAIRQSLIQADPYMSLRIGSQHFNDLVLQSGGECSDFGFRAIPDPHLMIAVQYSDPDPRSRHNVGLAENRPLIPPSPNSMLPCFFYR